MSIARSITSTAALTILSTATLSAGAADIVFNAGTATPARAQAMAEFKAINAKSNFSTHMDGRIGRVYGRAFSHGFTAAESVDAFISQHADMWGVNAAELVAEGPFDDRRHTMPVMYQPETDTYKFTATYFTQTRAGLPVYASKLVLLTRNEEGNPLVLASSHLFDLSAFEADPVVARAAVNRDNLLDIANDRFNGDIRIWSTDRMIYAGTDAKSHAPVVADITILDIDGYEKIEMITDAATGEILHADSIICTIDATGNVSALASDGPAADICENEIAQPLPYLNVSLQGGGSAITDVNGNYAIANGGSGNVTIDAELDGQWFNINDFFNNNSAESITADPANPINILFNSLNNSEQVRSEVNVYIESNRIRDWVLEANPSYPLVAGTEMEVFVNRTDGFCPGNAWYDPAIDTTNYCQSGSSNPNTGWSSVVHHEYGHHLVSAGGSGQGQYGEGTGDVMSVIILDNPDLGIGFFGSCGSALRSANQNLSFPCSGVHACAPLYSGAVWGTRNLLAVTEPTQYQQLLMSWAVNSIFLHSGTEITPQMTIDYLTLDDDDADIGNGTPHYFEIDGGFGARNMPAPPLNLINIEPVSLPDFANPAGGTTITAEFTNVTGELDTATTTLMVDTGSGFQPIPMSNVGGNTYEADLPSSDCGSQILFYIAGTSTSGVTQTSPSGAPGVSYATISATSAPATVFDDDFESNTGWTVSGDAANASEGRWQRAIPTGNAQRGDPANDFDGSSRCYLTGNGAPGDNNDVDGGTTILTSPTMDATGAAFISYARWYSNSFGASPNADTFVVEVSDDNGSTWSNLETVGPGGVETDGGWYQVQYALADVPGFTTNDEFRIRFTASDFGDGSVVEAGVDAVSLSVAGCDATCPADLNGDGNLDFFDVSQFLTAFNAMDASADFNGDGNFDFFDVSAFLTVFNAGCP